MHAMYKYITKNIGERMRHTSEIVHHIHRGYMSEGKQLSHAQHTTALYHITLPSYRLLEITAVV